MIEQIRCLNCGANIEIDSNENSCRCQYCESVFHVQNGTEGSPLIQGFELSDFKPEPAPEPNQGQWQKSSDQPEPEKVEPVRRLSHVSKERDREKNSAEHYKKPDSQSGGQPAVGGSAAFPPLPSTGGAAPMPQRDSTPPQNLKKTRQSQRGSTVKAVVIAGILLLFTIGLLFVSKDFTTGKFQLNQASYQVPQAWSSTDITDARIHYPLGQGKLEVIYSQPSMLKDQPYTIANTIMNGMERSANSERISREFGEVDGYPAGFQHFYFERQSARYEGYAAVITTEKGTYTFFFMGQDRISQEIWDSVEAVLGSINIEGAGKTRSITTVADYVTPVYQMYNSFASENGLGDTPVKFTGHVESLESHEGISYYRISTDEGDWIFGLEVAEKTTEESLKDLDLVGRDVYLFVTYLGYSVVFDLPVVAIEDPYRDVLIEMDSGKNYFYKDFY